MNSSTLTRRELLIRATTILPAMHLGLTAPFAQQATPPDAFKPRFRELTLHTADIATQKTFYTDKLNLPLLDETATSLSFAAGATRLKFIQSEETPAPFYHFAFNIPENKLESAMKWMKGRAEILTWHRTGEKIVHFRNWNAHSVYFFDPAGNILEFIAHHELDNAGPGPFTANDILAINEIGIVVVDVNATVAEIENKTGAKTFQSGSPVFTPIGDREGLFICVKSERIWLPTKGIKARAFPLEVHLNSASFDTPLSLESAAGIILHTA